MDKYGLIGYPLGHSFSKNYFNEKFENEGIDAQYIISCWRHTGCNAGNCGIGGKYRLVAGFGTYL